MRRSYTKGYFDLDTEEAEMLAKGFAVEDLFYVNDIKQRKLFLNSDIDQFTVEEVAHHILQFNKEDRDISPENRTPILLYITSNGGDVDAGFELVDIIKLSKTPVYTINLGFQYSMGFLLGLAGHKRYAMPSAKFLLHDGTSVSWNSTTKAIDQMEFRKKVEQRIKSFVIERSKLTAEEYEKNLRVEWYLFADEAKEKGFVDYIVGEDCDINEII